MNNIDYYMMEVDLVMKKLNDYLKGKIELSDVEIVTLTRRKRDLIQKITEDVCK